MINVDYGWLVLGGALGAFVGYWVAMVRVRLSRAGRGWKRPL